MAQEFRGPRPSGDSKFPSLQWTRATSGKAAGLKEARHLPQLASGDFRARSADPSGRSIVQRQSPRWSTLGDFSNEEQNDANDGTLGVGSAGGGSGVCRIEAGAREG